MGKQIGLDMKLYRNSGTFGSPVWDLVPNVRDLNGPDAMDEADVSRRAQGSKQTEPTLRDISFDWEMVYDLTDADFVAISDAYLARSLIEFALADGLIATSGTRYLRVECKVFKFERGEPLAGANLYAVTAKPCYGANAPTYVTV